MSVALEKVPPPFLMSPVFSARTPSQSPESWIALEGIPRILSLLLPQTLQFDLPLGTSLHAWEEPVCGDELAAMVARRKTCASRLTCWWHSKGSMVIDDRTIDTLGLLRVKFRELLRCLREEEESKAGVLAAFLVALEYSGQSPALTCHWCNPAAVA